MASSTPEAPYERISPSMRIVAGIVLALSNFMVVLDLTIANVSVPHISGDLGISMEQGAWIITSYAVAEAICVPLTGWLADRFGSVRVFLASMFGFGVFSALCGLSVTLGMLVAFRIGQGLCGAPLMPMSQALLMRVFPPEQRGLAIGVWAMTTLLGPAFGPIFGGLISDGMSWHWIFLINVPFAAVCVGLGWWILKPAETATRLVPIDAIGLLLLVFWIGCLQIMLDIGRQHDWFGDWKIVALAIMAGIGFLVFVIWELTEEHPVVDLRVFRHPGFTFSVLTLALAFGGFFAGVVAIPQWLQASLGYTATKAGLTTAFTAFSALLTAQIVAKLLGKTDPRLLVFIGVTWIGITSLMRAGWTTGADFWTLSWPQILQGLGISFMMIPLTAMSLDDVEPHEVASAAGMQNFMRTMAIAIATSLVLTHWGNSQQEVQASLADSLNPATTLDTLSRLGFPFEQARMMISGLVEQEAVTVAIDRTFVMTALTVFMAAVMVWFIPKPKKVTLGMPGH